MAWGAWLRDNKRADLVQCSRGQTRRVDHERLVTERLRLVLRARISETERLVARDREQYQISRARSASGRGTGPPGGMHC